MIALVTSTTVAHAQKAEAEALFREGKKLMKKGSLAAACEKFEASERLDPAIGTELNLADCRQKNGQLASAWAMFVKAAQTGKRTPRGLEAKNRAAALEGKLVSLTITVPSESRLDGLVIKRNETVVDPGAYDTPVPVDPDDYVVTAEAPGHEHWKLTVSVSKKNKSLEVPRLDALPPPPPEPKHAPIVAVEPKPVATPPPHEQPSSFTGTRKLSLVLGIVGLGAAGGGVAFGLKAKSDEQQSDTICPTSRCNDPQAFDLNKTARSDGLLANIGMISGGAV
ncbi:MAG TPA: hypothetical protein VGO00_00585, partial [Kofleriaceae bacterium]|nr:hypothetical protein [Kofleriaceae bacterium]